MPGCLVYTFNTRLRKPEGVTFHKLHKDITWRNAWLEAVQRTPVEHYSDANVVCSQHFLPEDFVEYGNSRRLKKGVIPSQNLPNTTLMHSKRKLHFTFCDADRGINVPPQDLAPSTSSPVFPDQTLVAMLSTSGSSSDENIFQRPPVEPEPEPKSQKERLTKRKAPTSSDSDVTASAKKRRKLVKLFHTYSHSPSYVKKHQTKQQVKVQCLKKSIRNKSRQIVRLKKKVTHLKEVLIDLRKMKLVSDNVYNQLELTISGIPAALFKRYMINLKKGKTSRKEYPEELRSFALTLHFYSSKAYEYVRRTFNLCLPAQSVIRSWYSKINCDPGYSGPAFEILKNRVEEARIKGTPLVCSLVFDEMSIKKDLSIIGDKIVGYVDLGTEINDDSMVEATQALVLLVVGVNQQWKVPIAYFFINSLNTDEKANIMEEALIRLHDIGVQIFSITCDGPSTHFSMMTKLGCKITDIYNVIYWFPHPKDNSQKVYIIFDPCHMLKLMRNNFCSLRIIKNDKGEQVKWEYIDKLYKMQQDEGLNIANKLRMAHIHWERQKMKVNLAAQTLSKSVAEALQFLCIDLKMAEFEGAEATIEFIKNIDSLFDYLNSRNPYGRDTKSPLRPQNEDKWRPFLLHMKTYLGECRDLSGKQLAVATS